ncbi:Serine/threonine-protein kinase, active site [Sesbania bispinosa]|nr:Serine/threonine-protein kinase, active site [Sesbania bispinosa]
MPTLLLLMLLCAPFISCAQCSSVTEIQALTSFKLNLHDPLGALNGWDPSTPAAPCDWRGVSCKNDRVTELGLPRLQLGGRLSDRISDLRMLRRLSLRSNSFNGTIPPSLSKCTLLRAVFLQDNSLSGELPLDIGNLAGLQFLNVAGNNLSGIIPGELPLGLKYVDLSANAFSGEIPSTIASLSQVQLINLSYNQFSGQIPASIGVLQNLQYLWLDHNFLGGTLPSALANCTSLVHLSAEGNTLTGVLPAAISALPKLQVLSLAQNNLTGSVPASIFCNAQSLHVVQLGFNGFTDFAAPQTATCFSALEVLEIQSNRVRGKFPLWLTNVTSLSVLDVSGNALSGEIPPEIGHVSGRIGNLSRLMVLNLSGNGFSGEIPASLGNLLRLTTLDLSKQNLSGELPFELSGLPGLQVIALQENKLSGDVPEGFSSLTSLQYVNLSSNEFSGHIPKSYGFLPSLVVLSLSDNHITGMIPPEIGNCSEIEILELGSNSLAGPIPSDLSGLVHLKVLDLSWNNLSGDMPEGISKCLWLTVLLADHNHLSGAIPESLAELSNLTMLDLSANKLSGGIPSNLSMIPDLVYFNVSGNKLEDNQNLCGNPLDRKCTEIDNRDRKSLLRWRKRLKAAVSGEKKKSPRSSGTSRGRGSIDNGGPKLIMFNTKITLAETMEATRNFDEENVLSRTKYGLVFKACYNDGMILSIRRLPDGSLDENMFRKEAESLGKIKHRNLTVLRGYYAGPPDMRLLAYDYMPNGNLATLLQEASHQDGHVLNWPMRHLIALGIARGLAFLHQSLMVHGDMKPQNVLFDADFEAHLSDFGLDPLTVLANPIEASTSTSVGTLGYVSPEAVLTGEATKESDVYSFGIVMLELLTGKKPVMFTEDEDIVKWVKKQLQKGQITELLEPGLLELDPESSEWEEFLLGVKVGLLCTAPDPLDRPPMSDIVFMLEGCRVGPDIPSSVNPTTQPSPA